MTWNDKMRTAVLQSGQSLYSIAKQADMDVAPLQRFVKMSQGITLMTAEKIGRVIGLKLCQSVSRRRLKKRNR